MTETVPETVPDGAVMETVGLVVSEEGCEREAVHVGEVLPPFVPEHVHIDWPPCDGSDGEVGEGAPELQ